MFLAHLSLPPAWTPRFQQAILLERGVLDVLRVLGKPPLPGPGRNQGGTGEKRNHLEGHSGTSESPLEGSSRWWSHSRGLGGPSRCLVVLVEVTVVVVRLRPPMIAVVTVMSFSSALRRFRSFHTSTFLFGKVPRSASVDRIR
jgi:hypothetical protein